MRLKLTDATVSNLKFQHPQYMAWDLLLPGFGVRVGSRSKTFVIVQGKSRKRTKIGRYPLMSLQKAREAARLKLSDPLATPGDSSTISAAVDKYLNSISVKDRTHTDYTRFLNTYLVPPLGSRKVETVAPQDILKITDPLLDRAAECRHAHAAMNTFFNWCVPRYIAQSPMAGLKCPTKAGERDRVLIDDELKAVWKASLQLDNYGVVVRLILLLAFRRDETIDPKVISETTVTLLDSKSNKKHTLPITPYMHDLLSQVRYTNGWSKNKSELDKLSKVTGFTHHDLRRTTSTNLCRPPINADPFIVERILNHSMPKLQKIYNRHEFIEAMREPLRRHEEWLLQLVQD